MTDYELSQKIKQHWSEIEYLRSKIEKCPMHPSAHDWTMTMCELTLDVIDLLDEQDSRMLLTIMENEA